ncbi:MULTISPECIES: hypothetical protein [unclassified Acinetobacter]|uniref:hypothetical protein n=1 Tax=unclassified Acinetobacter TaxID=196816 RepID=UPI0022EB8F36|nr:MULTISPECIES: hypothetical protein [unclassified Acinetobacter]MDA3446874.1 hypothetical protein [Acinetobacter sp. AOR40_HL]MDA3454335.1 hypothetical protein [Acinetobacter sp. AOR39_HL]
MEFRAVKMHKMFRDFHEEKERGYIGGEFKHEVRQFQKPYDNQQAEQISLMV